jgi:uncharacterized membrane protein YhaH (DUF805 family)
MAYVSHVVYVAYFIVIMSISNLCVYILRCGENRFGWYR